MLDAALVLVLQRGLDANCARTLFSNSVNWMYPSGQLSPRSFYGRTPLHGALRGLASLIHYRMSAFVVAIGGKAVMAYCSAHVRL